MAHVILEWCACRATRCVTISTHDHLDFTRRELFFHTDVEISHAGVRKQLKNPLFFAIPVFKNAGFHTRRVHTSCPCLFTARGTTQQLIGRGFQLLVGTLGTDHVQLVHLASSGLNLTQTEFP